MSKAKYISKLVDASGSTTSANVSYTGTLTGSTSILNIGSGQLYKDASGYVGIGTSSPAKKLDVLGEAQISFNSINTYLYYQSTNNYTGRNTDGNMWMNVAAGYSNVFGVAGVEKMRIDSSGNVGIGTSSPAADTAVTIFNAGTALFGTGLLVRSGYPGYTGVAPNILSLRDKDNTTDTFNIKTDGSLSLNRFSAAGTYTNSLTVNASGNVGIGTSSPAGKLSITQSTAGATALVVNGVAARQFIDYAGGGGSYFDGAQTYFRTFGGTNCAILSASTNSTLQLTSSTGYSLLSLASATGSSVYLDFAINNVQTARLFSDSNSMLAFATGSAATERMRIDASGNVGIGTSSPAVKLEVKGVSNAEAKISTDSNAYAYLTLNTWALDRAQLRAEAANPGAGSGTGSGVLSFWTANNSALAERMRIDSSGNVGIGTSSPVAKLNVSSSTVQNDAYGLVQIESTIAAAAVNASYTAKNYSGTSQFMQWENYGVRIGSRFVTNTGAGNVVFTTGSDVERMRIDSSGRVTTPYQPAFHATSANAPTTNVEWVFNGVTFNRGNYYNATTGRFTAPVTGIYYFYVFGLAGNADVSDIRISLRVNSATFAGARFILTKSAAAWQTLRGQAVMNLNAGDYVSPWNDQSTIAFHTDANYTGFGGYLIG